MTHSCDALVDRSGAINCVNPDSQVTEIPFSAGSKCLLVVLLFVLCQFTGNKFIVQNHSDSHRNIQQKKFINAHATQENF